MKFMMIRAAIVSMVALGAPDAIGDSTNAAPSAFYTNGWDDAVGLWSQRDEAGRQVHITRSASWMLLSGALDGELSRMPVRPVLEALRSVQATAEPKHGNFKWNYEDPSVEKADSNAAFFICLGLIPLRYDYGADLSDQDRALLDTILREANVEFSRATAKTSGDAFVYPNKSIGDLVCRWLISELYDQTDANLVETMRAGARYYLDKEWGWGEHLSDLYAKVIQDELLMLLMYSKKLPPDVRGLYEEMWRELAAIDAAFIGGPRVPTIRCYEMNRSPVAPGRSPNYFVPYAEWMSPAAAGQHRPNIGQIGRIAAMKGFRLPMPAVSEERRDRVTIPCFGGAEAQALVRDDWRMGTVTRYPLMPNVDGRGSGLAWQSMPVAAWRKAGDWMYLQWESAGGGETNALPRHSRFSGDSHVLSDKTKPPAVGETRGRLLDNGMLVLRRMPEVAPEWDLLRDGVRIVDGTFTAVTNDVMNGWQRLMLSYTNGEVWTFCFHPPAGEARMHTESGPGKPFRWIAEWTFGAARPASTAGLWLMTVGDAPFVPPKITTGEGRARVTIDGEAWLMDWSGLTTELRAAPVPAGRPVTIDGDLSDWDLSRRVLFSAERTRKLLEAESTRLEDVIGQETFVSAMYDRDALYITAHVRDATPMINLCDPAKEPDNGWMGDCLQLRFRLAGGAAPRIAWVNSWFHSASGAPVLRVMHRDKEQRNVDGLKPDRDPGGAVAFRKDSSGAGYVQELRIPWSLLGLDADAVKPELIAGLGIEVLGGDTNGRDGFHLTDLVATPHTDTSGFFRRPEAWGRLVLE